ncbi:MAG TPA: glycosyl hydrolase family 65 protein [Jatrophihabitans sp.]|nr:glycosyl hydrolase family 65 protein [Jatrophihabitans sp.]
MIRDQRYPVEPWHVRELGLDLSQLAQSESIFALSNGHIGARGNLDEGEPYGLPGTYLNSFYEQRPLPYAEAGYGYPESGQTIVNITNAKLLRLLVDDEPFDLRYGRLMHHERILDLRAGLLRRVVEWASPAGQIIRVRSTRLVSFTQRAVLAVRYQVEAVGDPARVVVQSEMVANESIPAASADPRVAAALSEPLVAEEQLIEGDRAMLLHYTRSSKLRMAAISDHQIETDGQGFSTHTFGQPDWTRTTIGTRLEPGQRLTVTKFVAYGWSSQRSAPALRDQVDAALAAVIYTGWDGLVAEQREYLDEFWDGADVEVHGDDEVQQAVRFGLFHTLQAGARSENRAIAAKGLTGPGYDGHSFWDSEMFVLPVLTATAPTAAADALGWRRSIIDLAVERARTLGHRGAAFPWRTIAGEECSGYWPAGTAAFHVNADIAAAAVRYVQWTGDTEFDRHSALPILVQTARLWLELGHYGEQDGAFHIEGVTGPDEYSALVADNTYTNLMAARNLRYAALCAQRWVPEAERLGVDRRETEEWLRAAEHMHLPVDATGMPEQFRDSVRRERWDFAATAAQEAYPLLLNYPYFDLYRKQVVKQADLVLAMHWCGDAFTLEQKRRAFEYYEALTVRDSSLSACSQAVLAAEVGYLELAHSYVREAAFMDLADLEHNTRDGLHIASLAGAWLGMVCGFGGLRDHDGQLAFAPRLPPALTGLTFTVRWHGHKVRVQTGREQVHYSLQPVRTSGPLSAIDSAAAELVEPHEATVTIRHHGQQHVLRSGHELVLDIPQLAPPGPAPSQPAGRPPFGHAG